MSGSRRRALTGAAALAVSVLLATGIAWAETRPPTASGGRGAPPPKGLKTDTEVTDFRARGPASGEGGAWFQVDQKLGMPDYVRRKGASKPAR